MKRLIFQIIGPPSNLSSFTSFGILMMTVETPTPLTPLLLYLSLFEIGANPLGLTHSLASSTRDQHCKTYFVSLQCVP